MNPLDHYRDQIDEIDSQMITLLSKRLNIAKKIAEEKSRKGLPIRDKQREKKVLERISSLAEKKRINPALTKRIFKEIIELSVKTQKNL